MPGQRKPASPPLIGRSGGFQGLVGLDPGRFGRRQTRRHFGEADVPFGQLLGATGIGPGIGEFGLDTRLLLLQVRHARLGLTCRAAHQRRLGADGGARLASPASLIPITGAGAPDAAALIEEELAIVIEAVVEGLAGPLGDQPQTVANEVD